MEQQTAIPEVKYHNPGVSRDLSTAKLTSGLPYQRPVETEDVDKLIAKWNPCLLTPIVVSFRDGNFNVVDGQHRIAAMRKMAGGGDVTVPCIIYTGLTYEQEAELYYMLDQTRGKLRLGHATKALVESGANAEIIDVKQRVEDAGFTWALDRPTGEPFEISTTRAVINAYRLLGGAAFSRMLGLIAGAWHGTPNSLKASIFSGMALFVKTYETELVDQIFIKRLSAVDPDEIIRRGKVDFSTNKAALRFARVILSKYNSQQRGGRKLPYRFKG
jgi:hypothetical protein